MPLAIVVQCELSKGQLASTQLCFPEDNTVIEEDIQRRLDHMLGPVFITTIQRNKNVPLDALTPTRSADWHPPEPEPRQIAQDAIGTTMTKTRTETR